MLILCLIGLQSVFAQDREVSGVVTSADDGLSIPGVSVIIKGTTIGTTTDFDGKYSISVPEGNEVLVFSFVGMKTTELPVTSNTINLVMESESIGVDEVMVVAYGTAKKSSFTGSASVVNKEDLQKMQVADVSKALEGLTSGVQVTSGSGQPGAGSTIRIRGIGSVNASADPLIVLDGFPYGGKLNSIPTSDIASLNVLKDASATSLYGSRAANGVIIITTNQGKKGKTSFNVKLTTGISSRAYPEYDRVNSEEYYELFWQKLYNTVKAGSPGYEDADYRAYASSNLIGEVGNYNIYKDVADDAVVDPTTGKVDRSYTKKWNDNWSDEMEDNSALRKDLVISASGGNEKSKFFISANVLDESGVMVQSKFKRYSMRASANSQMKDWIKVKMSIAASTSEQNAPTSSGSSYVNPFMFTRMIAPIYPVYQYNKEGVRQYDAKGNDMYDYGIGYGRTRKYAANSNPLGVINLDTRNYTNDVVTARTGVEFKLYEGLTFEVNASADYRGYSYLRHQNKNFGDADSFGGRSTRSSSRTFTFMSNQLLKWEKNFDDHNLNILVGHESEEHKYNYLSATRTGFPFPGAVELDAAAVAEGSSSYEDNRGMESYLSRIGYDYQNKYYLTLSFRSDASSRFHKDNRVGYFWSIGGSWRVSEENFMQNVSFVDDLKVKASYGTTGNDQVGLYAYAGLYGLGYNNLDEAGILASRLETNELKWEKNETLNVGLETRLFDRFTVGLEYYDRESKDLLFDQPLAPSTGFTSFDANIGSIRNYGFEFELMANVMKGDLTWDVMFNISKNINEITELPQEEMLVGTKKWKVGKSIYDFYIREYAGVNKTNGKAQYWMDEEVDGKITKVKTESYDSADRYYQGSSLPDWVGGITNRLSYKGLDLTIVNAFSIGGQIYDGSYASLMHSGGSNGTGWHKDMLDTWSTMNPNGSQPILDEDQNSNATSTKFLTSADYFKLRNITLGYKLPEHIAHKVKMESIRVYASGDNLFMTSKRTGLDPQQSLSGTTDNAYSPIRTISFGIDVKF